MVADTHTQAALTQKRIAPMGTMIDGRSPLVSLLTIYVLKASDLPGFPTSETLQHDITLSSANSRSASTDSPRLPRAVSVGQTRSHLRLLSQSYFVGASVHPRPIAVPGDLAQ